MPLHNQHKHKHKQQEQKQRYLLWWSSPRGNDPRHPIHPRFNGCNSLSSTTLFVSRKQHLPLCHHRHRQRVASTRHPILLLSLLEVPNLPFWRHPRVGPHLHLYSLSFGLSIKLRSELLAKHLAFVCTTSRLPRLRPRTRRRHCETRRYSARWRRHGPRCSWVLQCKFHLLLYSHFLVQPFFVTHFCEPKAVLFQHGCDGYRSWSMESRWLYEQNRGMDGVTEEDEDLPVGFSSTVSACVCWENSSGWS